MAYKKKLKTEKLDIEALRLLRKVSKYYYDLQEAFGSFCSTCSECPASYEEFDSDGFYLGRTCVMAEQNNDLELAELMLEIEDYCKELESKQKELDVWI